jgi:ferrous iron transport protein B
MLIATGCGVPAILSSRTIDSEKEKKLMIMTTTFMPCSAKLPLIALISSAFFAGKSYQWLISPLAYFLGIIMILISGVIFKHIHLKGLNSSSFIVELPNYHVPEIKTLLLSVFDKVKAFVVRAGTIILLASVTVWFLESFNWRLQLVSTQESILKDIGTFISGIFRPLGWNNWELAVSAVSGLVAKENIVSTMAILFGFSEDGSGGYEVLSGLFSSPVAISFLIFNLLCAPCFAAIGSVKREMNNTRWFWIAILYQCILAYVISFIAYNILTINNFSISTVIMIILVFAIIFLMIRPDLKAKKKVPVNG